MKHSEIDQSWWALRATYGLVAFLAGLDKFFNLLAHWDHYLSPWVPSILPFSTSVFMDCVGIIEMAVGILILTRWTRIGAYIACGWLLAIALNILTTGNYFDVAIRDVALSVGAWTLARLSEVRVPEQQPAAPRAGAGPAPVRA